MSKNTITTNNYQVTISNTLVRASYRLGFFEQRVLLGLAGKINPYVEVGVDRLVIQLTVEEFVTMFPQVSRKVAYEEFRTNLTENSNLAKDVLAFKLDKKRVITHWATKIEVEESVVTFTFNELIIPFLVNIRDNFTTYKLKWVAELKSPYSIRLYELFICRINEVRRNLVIFTLDLLDLKGKFNLLDKYRGNSDFITKVLTPAVQDINEYTDLTIIYDDRKYIKEGRKIVGVRLVVQRKENKTFISKNGGYKQVNMELAL